MISSLDHWVTSNDNRAYCLESKQPSSVRASVRPHLSRADLPFGELTLKEDDMHSCFFKYRRLDLNWTLDNF